jgi:hypothetical protein
MVRKNERGMILNRTSPSIWILMGRCSSDPDAYKEHDVTPGVTVEWQVSNGPGGTRSYSEDTVDPLEVFGIVQDMQEKHPGAEVFFGSHQERALFLKSVLQRLSGVKVSNLEGVPVMDWLNHKDEPVPVIGNDGISRMISDAVCAGREAGRMLSVEFSPELTAEGSEVTLEPSEEIEP